VPLPAAVRGVPDGQVIAGVRPESFEDAALAPEHHQGESFEFDAEIELVESMGSELYAYFGYEGETASSDQLEEIAADAGLADVPGAGETGRVVARLSPESKAASGQTTRLWLDAERLHLFDPHDGSRLSAAEKAGKASADGAPKPPASSANGAADAGAGAA
jgi:multiple sugar transport system ATP-binding protein